jgi:hypothetical protein
MVRFVSAAWIWLIGRFAFCSADASAATSGARETRPGRRQLFPQDMSFFYTSNALFSQEFLASTLLFESPCPFYQLAALSGCY